MSIYKGLNSGYLTVEGDGRMRFNGASCMLVSTEADVVKHDMNGWVWDEGSVLNITTVAYPGGPRCLSIPCPLLSNSTDATS